MVGGPGEGWKEFAAAAEGIHVLAVNPPSGVSPGHGVSLARAAGIPVKGRHLRGVVLGPGFASEAGWVAEAVRSGITADNRVTLTYVPAESVESAA